MCNVEGVPDATDALVALTPERQGDLARQMAMRLLREESGLAHGEIGRLLGNRAHSSVVEGIAALARKLREHPAAAGTWTRLQRRLEEIARTR